MYQFMKTTLLFLVATFLTHCSLVNNDDQAAISSDLCGKWYSTSKEGLIYCFQADGTFYQITGDDDVFSGTWTAENGEVTLSLSFMGETQDTTLLYSIDNDQLSLTSGSGTPTVLTKGHLDPSSITEIEDVSFSLIEYEEQNDQVTITNCDKTASGHLNIPAEINGLPVVMIGANAFEDCTEILSLSLPEGLQTIGDSAFSGCESLSGSLIIPETVTSIGSSAFRYCSNLTGSLNIPESVTEIGDRAFSGCRGFTTLSLPTNIDTLNDATFSSCRSLLGVIVIPENVQIISEYLFSDCYGISGVLLPDSVIEIKRGSFSDCYNLTEITLPASVTNIEANAFEYSPYISRINIYAETAPTITNSSFNSYGSLEIHITPTATGYSGEYWDELTIIADLE